MIQDKGLTVFSFWSPQNPTLEVDIFVEEPFDFEQAHARAVVAKLDSTTATVAAIEDIIALKKTAGRPQDELDIEALLALADAKG